jgi:Lrp/AsnC family transcriptional regulator, leucine-responsive regulatory protein
MPKRAETPLAGVRELTSVITSPVALDDFDHRLLEALAGDSRQSQRALARQVGMSPPAVADRIARLERAGVIRRYGIEVNWSALGYPVVVYIAVTAGPGVDLGRIVEGLRDLPEVQDMSIVTGALDLLVRLRVRDHVHLRELMLSSIFQIPGVQRTETFLSLGDVEQNDFTGALLRQLRDHAQQHTDPAGGGSP